VVVYPDGTRYDVAEELYRGCRGEGIIEISPEEYKSYLRNEASLDELIKKHRETGGAQTAASSGATNAQVQPQQGKQEAMQVGASAQTQQHPQSSTQPQQSNQTDLRNLPYLTLGEIAVRFGLLKLPNNNNRNREAGGGA
jgi:ribosomal protein L12E/L44/L45/RPP1/RPP2